MLPESIEKYIPKFFNRDAKLVAFADKLDSIIADLKDDTLGLNYLVDPVRCPAKLLDGLGFLLNAGIKQGDSESIKRQKISFAVSSHKQRGTWTNDAKPKIDAIAGGDAQIFRSVESDTEIVTGDGLTPVSYYWSTVGSDGIDNDLGIFVTGAGDEVVIPGNIYIDVDNSTLTAAQVQQIVDELIDDVVPAYMRIYLGYIDGTGAFVVYSGGIIN